LRTLSAGHLGVESATRLDLNASRLDAALNLAGSGHKDVVARGDVADDDAVDFDPACSQVALSDAGRVHSERVRTLKVTHEVTGEDKILGGRDTTFNALAGVDI